jgi:NAD(P)-dependent dehydrogenase (short-subunit alcohol dehydrogenase family)
MRRFGKLILSLVAATPLACLAQSLSAIAPKAVLVTGSSTGIGRKITERLAADGYFVYAGARSDQDLKALGSIKNVQAVRLDVTKTEDIDAAVETITKAGRGLYGLVNNAGVFTIANIPETKMEEFDLIMAVNVYGPWRITRAFAPLIVASKGRITNIGSISGIVSGPGVSAYAMSKHAMEAFTDSLAQEIAPLGVQVSIVDPGSYNTDIVKNAMRRAGQTPKTDEHPRLEEPDEVAAAVEQALFEPNPKRRYLVVSDPREAEGTIRTQIRHLVQLNEGQPYTYDRDALIKMLDEALARARPKTQ